MRLTVISFCCPGDDVFWLESLVCNRISEKITRMRDEQFKSPQNPAAPHLTLHSDCWPASWKLKSAYWISVKALMKKHKLKLERVWKWFVTTSVQEMAPFHPLCISIKINWSLPITLLSSKSCTSVASCTETTGVGWGWSEFFTWKLKEYDVAALTVVKILQHQDHHGEKLATND